MNNEPNQLKTDGQLVELAAKGDAEAFREIVERHQSMVYRTCLRILRNEADAVDASQATFIVLHRKCSKLNRAVVLGGWLYNTAGLVSREFIRSSIRRKRREEEAEAMNQEEVFQDNAGIWNALQPELDSALKVLPAKYRDVVVLRYLEDKSTNETAGLLGVSASVVTTRLARALEHLRVLLRGRGIVTSAGVLSVVLAENAAAAGVPATLGPAIINASGHGVMATTASAKVSLMADGALAKMGSVLFHLFNAIMFVAWIACMVEWVTRGCPIPRWVHILSGCLLAAGLGTVVILGIYGMLTLKLAAACILIPPAAGYAGWLWMFGPGLTKN